VFIPIKRKPVEIPLLIPGRPYSYLAPRSMPEVEEEIEPSEWRLT